MPLLVLVFMLMLILGPFSLDIGAVILLLLFPFMFEVKTRLYPHLTADIL